jgi:C1A family cysteine protease
MAGFDEEHASEAINLDSVVQAIKERGASWFARNYEITTQWERKDRIRLAGALPPGGLGALRSRSAAAKAGLHTAGIRALPPQIHDWRNYKGKNYVAPVRDQGGCGSCVAFGCCATAEGVYRVQNSLPDDPIDLSEAQLFYCHGAAEGRNCDSGWWPDRALNAMQGLGVVPEVCFPYTAGDQPCSPCTNPSRTFKVTGWKILTNTSAMKASIVRNGPLVACMEVFDDFYYYGAGVYRHVQGGSVGGHCISCVGFDDTLRAWICKNSWGTTWGQSGYFLIAYGECGIDAEMWEVAGLV